MKETIKVKVLPFIILLKALDNYSESTSEYKFKKKLSDYIKRSNKHDYSYEAHEEAFFYYNQFDPIDMASKQIDMCNGSDLHFLLLGKYKKTKNYRRWNCWCENALGFQMYIMGNTSPLWNYLFHPINLPNKELCIHRILNVLGKTKDTLYYGKDTGLAMLAERFNSIVSDIELDFTSVSSDNREYIKKKLKGFELQFDTYKRIKLK